MGRTTTQSPPPCLACVQRLMLIADRHGKGGLSRFGMRSPDTFSWQSLLQQAAGLVGFSALRIWFSFNFKPCRHILTALSLCNTAFEDLESSPKQGPMLKTLFPGIKPRPTSTFVFSHRLMLLAGRHVLHSNAMCLKFRFHVPSVREPKLPADACRTVGLAHASCRAVGHVK